MKNFTIDAQLIRSAMACQDKKSVRYHLNGFLLSASGHIVATNGNILFKSDYNLNPDSPEPSHIEADSIIRIEGTIPLNSYTCEFLFKDDFSGHVQTDKGKLFPFVIVDGKYPDYERVIPVMSLCWLPLQRYSERMQLLILNTLQKTILSWLLV